MAEKHEYFLFVENLPSKITEDQIRNIFSKYGELKKVVREDTSTAYIVFCNEKDALKANFTLKEEKLLKINDQVIEVTLISKKSKAEQPPKQAEK